MTLIGQVVNKSGQSCSMMVLNVVFYDVDGNLLDLSPLLIVKLEKDDSLSIKEDFMDIEVDGYSKIGLEFKSGILE